MFLAWYLYLEPSHITGLEEGAIPYDDLTAVFNAAHDWLLPTGADTEDAEALYVAGLAAGLCPWALGDMSRWEARSEAYRARYRSACPAGSRRPSSTGAAHSATTLQARPAR